MLNLLLSILSSVVCACCLLTAQKIWGKLQWALSFDNNNGTEINYGNNGISKRQLTKKVNLDVYYECLCPHSISFYRDELIPIMKQLGSYINLRVYPYGKASTRIQNGIVTFECQHGEKECYGNKLHACAMEQLPLWLDFNACLMSDRSDDNAVDECARMFNTNSLPIKLCAKGQRGTELLKYYGEESAKVIYHSIPYIRINGVPIENRANLMTDLYHKIFDVPNPSK